MTTININKLKRRIYRANANAQKTHFLKAIIKEQIALLCSILPYTALIIAGAQIATIQALPDKKRYRDMYLAGLRSESLAGKEILKNIILFSSLKADIIVAKAILDSLKHTYPVSFNNQKNPNSQ